VCAVTVGDVGVTLTPLTTGTTTKSSATGTFCTGQGSSQKGAFKTDICQAGANSGLPCLTNANCPSSICRSGTTNNYCQSGVNIGKGCSIDTNCDPAPVAGACTKAGTLVQFIRTTGVAGAGGFSLSVPKAVTLGSVFCVPVTPSGTITSNANLPGPGATTLPGTITTLP
jgi:hypothetical protein